ncbi:hypothetical protein V5799_022711 [Amblyomma americanum]|uniref:Uncharacterized protein n=1 Tax=Amblyomma americanum TaxID=6943 RepID=A0AAQ4FLA8_AMBAM
MDAESPLPPAHWASSWSSTDIRQPGGTTISQLLRDLQQDRTQNDRRALICCLLVLLSLGSLATLMLSRIMSSETPPGLFPFYWSADRPRRHQLLLAGPTAAPASTGNVTATSYSLDNATGSALDNTEPPV